MTVSIVPGYDFGANETPNSERLAQQATDMQISGVDLRGLPTSMVRAYPTDLFPSVGDGGSVYTGETTASGADTEGSLVMDRAGNLWVRTRWGPTRFHSLLGGFETRRWPYLSVAQAYPSHGYAACMLQAPQSANDTSATDRSWGWDSADRNFGVIVQTDITNATVGSYTWHPRVALYGYIGVTATNYPSASWHRGVVLDSAYVGATFMSTSQQISNAVGHILMETVCRYFGHLNTSYLGNQGGMFFGHHIPAAGQAY